MSYGLRIYGPNNGRLLFDEAMRYQRIVSQTYFNLFRTHSIFIPLSEADNPNLNRIAISQYEVTYTSVSTSTYGAALEHLEVEYSYFNNIKDPGNALGFTIKNTYDGTWDSCRVTGDVVCIRIG